MNKIEFGDFQTPSELIVKMFEILDSYKFSPDIIVEPTCGKGRIIKHSLSHFSQSKILGIEINKDYVKELVNEIGNPKVEIINADIFNSFDLISQKIEKTSTALFIGNPPWITNSKNSAIGGANVPIKSNLKSFSGIDAITGKSNFDISEYILIKLIERFYLNSIFAFLCKTSVARKILTYVWNTKIQYKSADIYPINAKKYFNASCEASFFIIDFSKCTNKKECKVYNNIEEKKYKTTYAYAKNRIIKKNGNKELLGKCDYVWRSGIKHDLSKVFELTSIEGSLYNGFNELVDIEDDLVYPLFKSSDLMKEEMNIRKKIIVPQKKVGEETSYIQQLYPKTHNYLNKHSKIILMRKSKVYKNKPPFSIFSIGEYSFKPYKIAISGLAKKVSFKLLKPVCDKPIMLDDTCNFLSFDDEKEAEFIYGLLSSNEIKETLNSIIFFDSKRPITIEVLNSIDLYKLATKLNVKKEYENFLFRSKHDEKQLCLFSSQTDNVFLSTKAKSGTT